MPYSVKLTRMPVGAFMQKINFYYPDNYNF